MILINYFGNYMYPSEVFSFIYLLTYEFNIFIEIAYHVPRIELR